MKARRNHALPSLFACVCVSLALALPCLAAAPRFVVVPAGTAIHFRILRTISTATAKPGERVPAVLTAPLTAGGRTIANRGARAVVRIRDAEASGRIGGSARLVFTLSEITLGNGGHVRVRTSNYVREGRAHARHNAAYIAGAGIVGAIVGQAIGHDAEATQKGAAIGAGAGIGAAAATGKFDFEVRAGSRYRLRLRAPLRAEL